MTTHHKLRAWAATAVLALVATGAVAADSTATSAADSAAIRQVLMAQFDRPDARLQVAPVVVVGRSALAGWAQGERGGRALLLRHGTAWQIAVCGGDGLKDPQMLRDAGLGPADAEALAKGLVAAEAQLPAAHRAKFSTFDGLLRMDRNGHHPPTHRH